MKHIYREWSFIYICEYECMFFFFFLSFEKKEKERRENVHECVIFFIIIYSVSHFLFFLFLAAFIDASIEGTVAAYIYIYIYVITIIFFLFLKKERKISLGIYFPIKIIITPDIFIFLGLYIYK